MCIARKYEKVEQLTEMVRERHAQGDIRGNRYEAER